VSALTVHDLVAGYEPGVPIVNGASLSVEAGEIVAVLGPNGAGKSTLIKAIAGVAPIRSGAVFLDDEEITQLPAHLMVRKGLAFVPQTENVFTTMSVEDNLLLASGILPSGRRAERIAEVYDFFPDLAVRRRLSAGRLSGGQRQMAAIARALIAAPRVLMLDEPSAGLSPKLVEGVFARLAQIRASGVAIVLVEQNALLALKIADRAYVLDSGRVVHSGPAAELAADRDRIRTLMGLEVTAR
jgi:branched-chain amino acid transport system ATP-binding protein